MLKSFFRKRQASSSNPQQQALQHIQVKLKQAIGSWKKRLPARLRSNLTGSPWFLVVGSAHSGKTTLLAKSELDLNSNHSAQVDCSKPTRSPEFWSCGQHLFVDIPGDWYSSAENSENEQRFHHLLNAIPTYRRKRAPTSILQVIDIHKVSCHDSPEKDREFALASKQLQFLHDWNNNAQVHLILNQADSIPGFDAFFSQLSQDERKQLMGIGLEWSDNQPLFDSLHAQFNAFYNQLSAQTIKRLHQERSQIMRDLIKDFPFQMKSLLARINQLLETLPEPVLRRVQGIYFTSCHQQPRSNEPNHKTEQAIQLFAHNKTDQVYFIEDLFLALLAQNQSVNPRWRSAYSHTLLAAAAITIGIYAIHTGFNHSKKQLNQLNQSLHQQDIKPIAIAPPWLNQLIRLQYVEGKISHSGRLKENTINRIALHTATAQQHEEFTDLLNQQFKPFILNQITSALAADIQNQSPHLIADFIAYFKLTQIQLDTQPIVAWFKEHWQQHYPENPTEVTLLIHCLQTLLKNQPHFAADTQLLQQARALIASTPAEQIIFNILQSQSTTKIQSLEQNLPVQIAGPLLQYNAFYDPTTLSLKLNQEIPAIISQLMTQTWILGRPLVTLEQKAQVENSVKVRYLSEFSQHWKNAFNQLNLNQGQQLEQDAALTHYLSDQDSSLWQTMHQVSELILKQNPAGTDTSYWQKLKQALSDENNQTLLTASLKEASSYLRNMAYADNTGKAVFFASKKRMHADPASNPLQILLTLSHIVPKPISTWLQQLSQQSWQHMLAMSADYLNTQWKNHIYSDYKKAIDNRYPFFNDSKLDTHVKDFNQFFGLDGSIQKFYEQYLADFVKLENSNWSLKTIAGQKLALNPAVMNSVVQASLIQKMFYKNNKETPSSRFSLKPTFLSKKIKTLTLEVNGKATDFSLLNFKPFTTSWPGNTKNSATLQCTTVGNVKFNLHHEGPWAWLRLLKKARISHSKQGTYFDVVFDFNQQKAKFKLAADNQINPYLSDVLNKFRIPQDITSQ